MVYSHGNSYPVQFSVPGKLVMYCNYNESKKPDRHLLSLEKVGVFVCSFIKLGARFSEEMGERLATTIGEQTAFPGA